jgi:enoyl-CoA hydratase
MAKEYEVFEVEKKDHIGWLFMNRPEKRNAVGKIFFREILEVMAELEEDDDVRVVILAGRGKCFTAGTDLFDLFSEVPGIAERGVMGRKRYNLVKFIIDGQESISVFDKFRKPVIAAIHHYCIGAGVDIITACDIRLATEDALFSVREARLGVVADVGTLQRLPRIVGEGYAKELTYTTKDIDAKKANEIGLVNEVYKDIDALYAGAEAMAKEIAEQSPLAVMSAKEVMNYCRDKSVADGLNYVAQRSANILPSEDIFEALQAFTEKRKPNFKGE